MTPAILLTRPEGDSAEVAAALRARLDAPRIEIAPVLRIAFADAMPPMEGVGGLIFTSRNGVRAWQALGGPVLPCYCVGEATADLARAEGVQAVSAAGNVSDLADRIVTDRPGGHWMHLHGAHVRGALVNRLRAAGLTASSAVLYRQDEVALTAEARRLLAAPGPVVLPVYSPRSAALIVAQAAGILRAPVFAAAISPHVQTALSPLRWTKCAIAGRPDADAMLETTIDQYHAALDGSAG
ncbi:uroporphyrinogen-III synthase [Pseudooceanicola sp. 216_PA32_1]|uniref:Uroporphyrinogen-III synthase n=1 Tax=Pseudooceanicola pacificus TaxID=2676438 RepID=A0A844W254_9RHOB|nr:uroporphyrinogen-III synthase [Pseudooceanicola pacificus]MWB76901.1 uroporphyrinogen-III synthase [Pseudooceanicola pacificus]